MVIDRNALNMSAATKAHTHTHFGIDKRRANDHYQSARHRFLIKQLLTSTTYRQRYLLHANQIQFACEQSTKMSQAIN